MLRKRIIITGASTGLGREMACQYAAMGRDLALCARRLDKLQALQQQLVEQYPQCRVIIAQLDVDDHQQVFAVFDQFATQLDGIDRIIVNAGIGKGASVGTGHFEANKQTAMTNFVSALAQCEAAMTLFRRQQQGHLVTISSFSAVRGFRRALNVYAATKAGLTSLSEGIRIDVLNSPISVTTIHPGFIKSDMNQKVEKVPFMVDTERGVRAMIRATEREVANAYVPWWPWAWLRWIAPVIPLSWLRRVS